MQKNYYYIIVSVLLMFFFAGCIEGIDREKLVKRHIVEVDSIDALSSLSVGNGRFAYTVDFTGLQSFPSIYEKGIPLGTQSEWGWHSYPNSAAYSYDETYVNYDFYGREVPYAVQVSSPKRSVEAVNYFRQNPHRLHLGIVGMDFYHIDGSLVDAEEITSISQTLDPWNGEIHSKFFVNGIPVEVITYCHQEFDLVSSQINSPLIKQGLIRIKLQFPYPTGGHSDSGCNWGEPEKHNSELSSSTNMAKIKRRIDDTSYSVCLSWDNPAKIYEKGKHFFYLEPAKDQNQFSFSCCFSPDEVIAGMPDFKSTADNSKSEWKKFWLRGGVIDFSESTNPLAFELERRIVLSQYLTKVNCAGSFPPQETGLIYNSWHGKFHLEMHWWHGVHFALWNRTDLLLNSLNYYNEISDRARTTASIQGFKGLRWPKMTSPDGIDSPSSVGSFLIWQQPHIIYMAELCYQDSSGIDFLRKYADVVFDAADFMASYAHYDALNEKYILGPYLIPAQERFTPGTTINPPFELAYWKEGLTIAKEWSKRLKIKPKPEWEAVSKKLSPLPVLDGKYIGAENASDFYFNPRYLSDHPMVIGVFGMLPSSPMLDFSTMKNTFEYIWNSWQWDETWGWDFPMTAMAATRLGMPEKAIEALFMDVETNTYLPNGHNFQDNRLRIYLPGNGALLTAVAMMCAGYHGCKTELPGFPNDGTWKVKWENLDALP